MFEKMTLMHGTQVTLKVTTKPNASECPEYIKQVGGEGA